MVRMGDVNEATILHNLRMRFGEEEGRGIYTNIGASSLRSLARSSSRQGQNSWQRCVDVGVLPRLLCLPKGAS